MDQTRKIADERNWRNRFSKTHRGVLDDPDRIDQDGVMGEQAFARYMGLSAEAIHARGPVSSNFVLDDGTRVDVRASRASFCKLIVPPAILLRGKIDAFVLAEIRKIDKKTGARTPPSHPATVLFPDEESLPVEKRRPEFAVTLRGWATPEDLAKVTPRKISDRPGATEVHLLAQHELRSMEELRKHHILHTKSLFDGLEGL